jgi:ATP-dependent phosphofructokinase / diphosphate-dependent phosphofructokinase
MPKKIGILTAGSDCPGLNAAIRAVGKAARNAYGMEIIGFQDGFKGLIDDQVISIESQALSGILTTGGTILGTSRDKPHAESENDQIVDRVVDAAATYHKHQLDGLVCIGGCETQESAFHLMQQGLNVLAIPKSINNEVPMTDTAIGFDTAISIATEAIDRLHSTAHSHHRIILVEIMGHEAGWLTLGAGLAGGADVIAIPEIPYDAMKIADAVLERNKVGKRYSIVAVAEGALAQETVNFFEHSKKINESIRTGAEKEKVSQTLDKIENRLSGNAIPLAYRLEKYTGLDTRITILGHLLRGGAPSAADRNLASQLGTTCARLANEGHYGVMLAIQNGSLELVPLDQILGKRKQVPLDHPWIESARLVGTCLGD